MKRSATAIRFPFARISRMITWICFSLLIACNTAEEIREGSRWNDEENAEEIVHADLSTPPLMESFLKLDSMATERQIANLLDTLKSTYQTSYSNELNKLFAYQLQEHRSLYTGRGKNEVNRLRAYMLITLAETGPTLVTYPTLFGILSNAKDALVLGAAARASGKLKDNEAAFLVPLLIRILGPDYHDFSFSLTNYDYQYPIQNATCMKLESIRALGKLGSRAGSAVDYLENVLNSKNQVDYSSELTNAISTAVASIKSDVKKNPLTSTTADTNFFSTPLFTPDTRRSILVDSTILQDHIGNLYRFEELKGKPVAMTFFYSSCNNPYKCSETIFQLANLQKTLASIDLKDQVRLMAITFDPWYDLPNVLKEYGKQRGLSLNPEDAPQALLLRVTKGQQIKLFKELKMRVNFGLGEVNHHGIQLYLIDREFRLAKIYSHVLWNKDEVVNDLGILTAE